jgi:tripartite motif-containing protein 71
MFNHSLKATITVMVMISPLFSIAPIATSSPSSALALETYSFVKKWGSSRGGVGQFQVIYDIFIVPPHQSGIFVLQDVYVGDDNRFQKFDRNGNFIRKWGSYCEMSTGQGCVDSDGAGPLELGDGQFRNPAGIAINSTGYVYVNDSGNQRIQIFKRN